MADEVIGLRPIVREKIMKKPSLLAIPAVCAALVVVSMLAPTFSAAPAQQSPIETPEWQPETFIIDHLTLETFPDIPPDILYLIWQTWYDHFDKSVGENTWRGLYCLSPEGRTFSNCNTAVGWVDGGDSYRYDRWVYHWWPGCAGDWTDATECFIANTMSSTASVGTFQFSYMEVASGSTIEQFFDGDLAKLDRHLAVTKHWPKAYWTSSLSRVIGSDESRRFNNRLRDHVRTTGGILLDFADIESHIPSGTSWVECTIPSTKEFHDIVVDGITKTVGIPNPVLCPPYTDQATAGHLNKRGQILMAKSVWVFMAAIHGWRPAGVPTPTPIAPTETPIIPTETSTPVVPTVTQTSTPIVPTQTPPATPVPAITPTPTLVPSPSPTVVESSLFCRREARSRALGGQILLEFMERACPCEGDDQWLTEPELSIEVTRQWTIAEGIASCE